MCIGSGLYDSHVSTPMPRSLKARSSHQNLPSLNRISLMFMFTLTFLLLCHLSFSLPRLPCGKFSRLSPAVLRYKFSE